MTINEIESTLQTLEARHPDLDESMLLVLLKAGGWEEKTIKDALLLFRGAKRTNHPVSSPVLASLQKEPLLPEVSDNSHLLLEHNQEEEEKSVQKEEIIPSAEEPKVETVLEANPEAVKEESPSPVLPEEVKEPQSLIEPSVIVSPVSHTGEGVDLPDNLPVRPFESAPHIWPFSKYKETFHTNKEDISQVEPTPSQPPVADVKKMVEDIVEKRMEEVKSSQVKNPYPQNQAPVTTPPSHSLHWKPAPLSSKDEKLIVLACTMFLLVLLLLGYMYSNGRL